MSIKFLLCTLIPLLLYAPLSFAKEEDGGTKPNSTESQGFRNPSAMPFEERQRINEATLEYESCLIKYVRENMPANSSQGSMDPRHHADAALKNCSVQMETLNKEIISWGYAKEVARSFTLSNSSRAANRLLRKIMPLFANPPKMPATAPTDKNGDDAINVK
ncbi:MAG: hypothetical protein ACYYK0_03520 [Candidatus Eutrophobiaceae bacterium]